MDAAPVVCPGCRRPMERLSLERKPLGIADVDLCRDCRAIWFDAHESLQLAPGAVLMLLRAIESGVNAPIRPLPDRMSCPRCGVALGTTHDIQRRTRFTYWRCPRGHGRFTPFTQFLREKDYIRPLGDEEIARLKTAVRIVRCASCGAPVDIERSTVCGYCRSPIVILDSGAIARNRDAPPGSASSVANPDGLIEAMIAIERERSRADPGTKTSIVDLVELGVDALLRIIAR